MKRIWKNLSLKSKSKIKSKLTKDNFDIKYKYLKLH